MSTKQTANVYIKNNTGGEAFIQISHKYSGNKPDVGSWLVAPGGTAGPLVVNYETGAGTGFDYWYCSASVIPMINPPNPGGIYASEGSLLNPSKECMLKSSDAGQTITHTINTSTFSINLPSGGCTTDMNHLADYPSNTQKVSNVFVFMLENHSFDHLFGFSSLGTVNGLTGNESNTAGEGTYKTSHPAVDPMPVGPGHEFMNTMVQLCGSGVKNPFPNGPYPSINNSGFVADYSAEGAGSGDVGDVMKCCTSSSQIPMLYKLAQNFALCDNWFSSMPGPTWPNRLFAMGASSGGLDDSPSSWQTTEWETVDGFNYENGSIFDLIKTKGFQYRLYNDADNMFGSGSYFTGQWPIVAGLENVNITDVHDIEHFASDLQKAYPYQFTWIEPHYGDADKDFTGGSSQHPTDSLAAGEKMIAAVYDAIRTSPYWNTSLLIITYDEHGGYYDHVAPPAATPPGDTPQNGNLNTNGFDFSQYGVRVPAVVISPRAFKGITYHTVFDHTSILKTVENLWGLGSLTDRDKGAHDLTPIIASSTPRQDTPIVISPNTISSTSIAELHEVEPEAVEPTAPVSRATVPNTAELDARPLPESGNIIGFLHVALKAEVEMSDGSDATKAAIIANFKATVHTYGDARAYFERIAAEVKAVKAAKQTD